MCIEKDIYTAKHTVSGEPGEPIAKRNCFGWYVLGQFESNGSVTSEIQSIEVCLLYTSPSPRDLSTSRMPSSA